jgi:hypothetical protein
MTDGIATHHIPSRPPVDTPTAKSNDAQTIQSWQGGGFRIELTANPSHPDELLTRLSYKVFDDEWARTSGHDALIFAGDDLLSASSTDPWTDAVRALSALFGCESGDIADSYFAVYSRAQLAWRDQRASALCRWGDLHLVR